MPWAQRTCPYSPCVTRQRDDYGRSWCIARHSALRARRGLNDRQRCESNLKYDVSDRRFPIGSTFRMVAVGCVVPRTQLRGVHAQRSRVVGHAQRHSLVSLPGTQKNTDRKPDVVCTVDAENPSRPRCKTSSNQSTSSTSST